MLYSEFIENTGCKQTDYNYQVYKSLEALYMKNDKLTKEDIYKAGKKLIDNSKTEEEKRFEEEINSRIEILKTDIEQMENDINRYKEYIEDENRFPSSYAKERINNWKDGIKLRKKCIDDEKHEIKNLKWVLGIR